MKFAKWWYVLSIQRVKVCDDLTWKNENKIIIRARKNLKLLHLQTSKKPMCTFCAHVISETFLNTFVHKKTGKLQWKRHMNQGSTNVEKKFETKLRMLEQTILHWVWTLKRCPFMFHMIHSKIQKFHLFSNLM